MLAFRSGDKDVARELLGEASEHNPDNELVWLWRASAARTRTEALTAVERVLELNPSNEKALSWIQKLQPGYVPQAPPESGEQPAEALNGAPSGVAIQEAACQEPLEEAETDPAQVAEDAVYEESAASQEDTHYESEAEVAETAEAAAETVDETEVFAQPEAAIADQAGLDEASYFERKDPVLDEPVEEQPQQVAEQQGEPVAEQAEREIPSDAEERLAALEAYLQRGAREEEDTLQHSDEGGYGWERPRDDTQQEPPETTETSVEPAHEAAEVADEPRDDEPGGDPLIGLLDSEERASLDAPESGYQEAVDGEPATTSEQDYQEQLAQLQQSKPAEDEDVWGSLGMASMEGPAEQGAPAAENLAGEQPEAPAAEQAAGMGFAEMGVSAKAAEETAPPAQEAPEEEQGCFICEKLAPVQEGVCSSCRSIVDLRLHELAPRHEGADRPTLTKALERLRSKIEKGPTADLCIKAAVTSLNLRQSNQALAFLREACRLRPHDRELLGFHDEVESRPLILAVDDSKTVQKMISTVLEKEAYRVSAAEDGLAAIAKLDEEMPKLILLDITMPRMDGYQVCKVITGNGATKHIPVVMLSGKDGFFDKVKGKMVGASNYITKPFDPNELTRTIAKFLKKDD